MRMPAKAGWAAKPADATTAAPSSWRLFKFMVRNPPVTLIETWEAELKLSINVVKTSLTMACGGDRLALNRHLDEVSRTKGSRVTSHC
jgi:hypothetical protein